MHKNAQPSLLINGFELQEAMNRNQRSYLGHWHTDKRIDKMHFLFHRSEFTAEKDGVRDTSDLVEKYKRGVFGALPEPDLFESLLEVQNNG